MILPNPARRIEKRKLRNLIPAQAISGIGPESRGNNARINLAREKQSRRKQHESYRHRPAHRRPWARGDPQGDPPDSAYPGERPVIDDIGAVAEILLRHDGFSQTAGVEIVHNDENRCAEHAYPGGRIWYETDNIIRFNLDTACVELRFSDET